MTGDYTLDFNMKYLCHQPVSVDCAVPVKTPIEDGVQDYKKK